MKSSYANILLLIAFLSLISFLGHATDCAQGGDIKKCSVQPDEIIFCAGADGKILSCARDAGKQGSCVQHPRNKKIYRIGAKGKKTYCSMAYLKDPAEDSCRLTIRSCPFLAKQKRGTGLNRVNTAGGENGLLKDSYRATSADRRLTVYENGFSSTADGKETISPYYIDDTSSTTTFDPNWHILFSDPSAVTSSGRYLYGSSFNEGLIAIHPQLRNAFLRNRTVKVESFKDNGSCRMIKLDEEEAEDYRDEFGVLQIVNSSYPAYRCCTESEVSELTNSAPPAAGYRYESREEMWTNFCTLTVQTVNFTAAGKPKRTVTYKTVLPAKEVRVKGMGRQPGIKVQLRN